MSLAVGIVNAEWLFTNQLSFVLDMLAILTTCIVYFRAFAVGVFFETSISQLPNVPFNSHMPLWMCLLDLDAMRGVWMEQMRSY
jgi:hypothetical protein